MHSRAAELQPLLLLDLYEAGWDGQVDYYPGQPMRQFAMTSLAKALMKKFHNDETGGSRDELALQLFLDCNKRCGEYPGVKPLTLLQELIINETKSLIYDFYNPCFNQEVRRCYTGLHIPENKRYMEAEFVRRTRGWFPTCRHLEVRFIGPLAGLPGGGALRPIGSPVKTTRLQLCRNPHLLNLSDISKHFGLGNGANRGSPSTDMYAKYVCSDFAHTHEILPILFREAVTGNGLRAAVEAFRSQMFKTVRVSGSRLAFASKNADISRVTCTEAIGNMLFQKGISGVHEERLREMFGIDLSKQPAKNSALAKIGSLTQRFGTKDLKSASDLIALRMIEEMFPPEPVRWFKWCRSPSTVLPDGTEVELHMVSSMGNGFTFTLMTTLFACLIVATYRVLGIKTEYPWRNNLGNFAVFGDDLIVEKRAYGPLSDCLDILGFVVNHEKSFNEGPFRESCGTDYFEGTDVRGVYIKKLLHDGDSYSAINRLNRWSSNHGIFLTRTVGRLRTGSRFIGVPYDEADDAGIKVPLSLLRVPRRDRNGAIHYLARCNVPLRLRVPAVGVDGDVIPNAAYSVKRTEEGCWYSPIPKRIRTSKGVEITSKRWFVYSADGVLLCLVAGWIDGGEIVLRSETRKRAVIRKKVCPGWDTSAFRQGVANKITPAGYEVWKYFVAANLSG